MTERVRVFLVDDHTLVRQGVRGLLALEPRIVVVGEASDVRGAIDGILRSRAQVVLLDVRLGGASGFDVIRGARARGLDAAFVVLTTFDDDATFADALRQGARGFLLKDVSLEDLVRAVLAVGRGETAFRPAITERAREVVSNRSDGDATKGPPPTAREREILRLLAAGYSNREIADALGVAEGTVKNHVSHLLAKLGVRDRTRAVLRAIELRLL